MRVGVSKDTHDVWLWAVWWQILVKCIAGGAVCLFISWHLCINSMWYYHTDTSLQFSNKKSQIKYLYSDAFMHSRKWYLACV